MYFDFRPVLSRRSSGAKGREESGSSEGEQWTRLGCQGDNDIFLFVGKRRLESYDWVIPASDGELMHGRADLTFESILLSGVDI